MANLHGKKFISALLALFLFAALALPCPQASAASALDPAHPVTLTVTTPADMPALKEVDFQVSVWRVADVNGSVQYTLTPAFDEIWFKSYTIKGSEISHEHNKLITDYIDEFADTCYARALGKEEGRSPVAPDAVLTVSGGTGTVSKTTAGTDLLPGYYLVVPGDLSVEVNNEVYRFAPTLVALPHISTVPSSSTGGTDTEDWVYDVTISPKPDKASVLGNVKIVKILNGYNEALEGADFIFTVRAVKDGKVVYSNVISLHFDKADWQNKRMSKEYFIYDLPVGALVEVEEVYKGSAYKLDSWSVDPEDGLVIAADENAADPQILTFTFLNSPDDRTSHGSSVLNHYEMVTGAYGHAELDDSTQEPSQSPESAN